MLAHLGQRDAVEVEELDILATPPETRTPAYLAKNPNGRIPLAELSNGSYLPESNAILCYLAEGTPWISTDPLIRAKTLAWMFFEQYSHERFVAVLKFWTYWGGLDNIQAEDIALWREQGQSALHVMNAHLQTEPFFSGPAYGIADIALFAYTQSAEAIGYEFQTLDAVREWLDRVRTQPGYVPMKRDPLGQAPDPI